MLLIVAVVAAKVAVVAAAATVTEVGTVSAVVLLASVTAAPPVGAALVKVTVHVVDPFDPRLLGLQASVDINTGVVRLTVVLAELLL